MQIVKGGSKEPPLLFVECLYWCCFLLVPISERPRYSRPFFVVLFDCYSLEPGADSATSTLNSARLSGSLPNTMV